MKKSLGLIIGIAFLAAACTGTPDSGSGELDAFAQCLSEEGAVMYGAYWCPHCADQKEMFGSSVDQISYIECSLPNQAGTTRACQLANIQSYPTWEFADGTRATGVVELSELAEKTGCELPAEA